MMGQQDQHFVRADSPGDGLGEPLEQVLQSRDRFHDGCCLIHGRTKIESARSEEELIGKAL